MDYFRLWTSVMLMFMLCAIVSIHEDIKEQKRLWEKYIFDEEPPDIPETTVRRRPLKGEPNPDSRHGSTRDPITGATEGYDGDKIWREDTPCPPNATLNDADIYICRFNSSLYERVNDTYVLTGHSMYYSYGVYGCQGFQ